MSLTFDDVKAAAQRIEGHVLKTPFAYSQRLSAVTKVSLWVKYENQQMTSAFKERGALNKLAQLTDEERARGVYAASAGNHAQGLAYHATRLGIPATIVMPQGTPFVKIQKTQSFGAKVVIAGANYDESSAHAQDLCREAGAVYVHPFDDYDVMAGQGTLAIEMLEAVPDLDVMLVPVGGGGLIAGMAVAAKAINPKIKVIGVEAAMYPSFAAKRNRQNVVSGGATIAEGIAVKEVGELTFEVANPLVDDVIVIDESDIERGIAMFVNVEKTVSEGAGATGLAAVLRHAERFAGQKVGLVLCGGNIDLRLLASVLQRELVREKRLVTYRILGDDRPGMLSRMADVISDKGGNIVDVAHNRLVLDVPAKGAEFDIMVETQDARHAYEIEEALRRTGYALRMD
ncbi:threonine ammonia-lyase [Asticcacaulis machinosus]|uniref:L-threonine dehydratase catabolic TdcB n=1 Tax=Asticcacaulis machinosus TaxID=2984211 RepID=A0ABT5HM18_9CAUL|nr:threonine ammonia-lyase [Asticcacaulis machinosus]MDC7677048.1 threonine ammonia-lyase [Asticcacaulis machinosus]